MSKHRSYKVTQQPYLLNEKNILINDQINSTKYSKVIGLEVQLDETMMMMEAS